MGFIADIFIKILESLNSLTGSFGLSLVFFAGMIKMGLWPLTNIQYKSMKAMQDLQPAMEKIKKDFKGDKEGEAKATQALFLERGVNPISGCLPLLVQMPILISIWSAIMGAPELFSNSYFLWIRPGPLQAEFPKLFAASLADRDALLILVYGLTMIIQQQMNPAAGKGHQKYIGLVMSVGFTIMMWFYSWPCALIIYWVVFNFLSIIQQGIIHRSTASETKDKSEVVVVKDRLPSKLPPVST